MSHPLLEMQRLGQSPWHDNIRRELLTTGKLAKMIADGDITGLTSNPTIFEQAISKSADYDADLKVLAERGKSAVEIFDALAIDDIQDACDAFAPVYRRTAGKDGYCSIEVTPTFANDTEKTISEAKRLWKTLDRPNLMVKIPATLEGLPAIEEATASGINVNVTLIFSLERYDAVMDAYLKGLIRRTEAGQPVSGIASVASFFVSRVDTAVDKLLDEKIQGGAANAAELEALKGKAGIANAKLAFELFRKKFATEAAAALASKGSQLQRPLWASTSTKNPALPDTYYVDALVGPDSVDTMPPATIVAFKDHGKPAVRIDQDLAGARAVMAALAAAGVDMDAVTLKLEEDGVASFSKSFESLIAAVEERRKKAIAEAVKPAAEAPKAVAEKRAPAAKPEAPAKQAKPVAKKTAKPVVKAKPAKKTAKPVRKPVKKAAAKRAAKPKKVAKKKTVARKAVAARKPKAKAAARKPAKKKTRRAARKK